MSAVGEAENVSVEAQDTTVRLEQTMKKLEVISPKERGFVREQPSSVSTVMAQQMEAGHINSLKGVSSMVPNFFMPDYGSKLTSAIYIRGIGSRINTPAVGLYVDGVPYIDKSSYDFNLDHIERVDVLRGPQGTLYGRNSMGGIVNVKTIDPFDSLTDDLVMKLGFASGDMHRNASLSYKNAFSKRFALSASAYYEGGSGFFKNDLTGKKADGLESGGGNVHAVWRLQHDWRLDAKMNYDYTDEYAYPYYYAGQQGGAEPYAELVGKISANRDGRYRRGMLNGSVNLQHKGKGWMMNAVTAYQFLKDRMYMDQDFIAKDIYTLEQRQRIHTLNEEITFRSTCEHAVWDWVMGVSAMHQQLHTDAPVTFYADGAAWLGSVINGYMPDVTKIPSLSKMGFTGMGVEFQNAPFSMVGVFDTPTTNVAFFHQSTFHITDRLSASLGLRLDYEHNSIDSYSNSMVEFDFTMNNPSPMMKVWLKQSKNITMEFDTHQDNYNVMPKLSLKYDLNHGGNVYFSLGKGMRSGGYNVQMISDLMQGFLREDMMDDIKKGVTGYLQNFVEMGMPPMVISSVAKTLDENMPKFELPNINGIAYKPEYTWSYELGTHQNFLTQGVLQADAAIFYMHTRNQQISRFAESGMGRVMVNAGKSENYGAELSMVYSPDYRFYLRGSYGYAHSKFTEWNMGSTGQGGSVDYSGNYVPYVPQHTVNVDASYTWDMRSGRCGRWLESVTLGADYTGAGKIYWTEANNMSQDFYSLLGARLALQLKGVALTFWGKNLTDARYNTFYFESVGRGFEQHGKPLQVGVDVKVTL